MDIFKEYRNIWEFWKIQWAGGKTICIVLWIINQWDEDKELTLSECLFLYCRDREERNDGSGRLFAFPDYIEQMPWTQGLEGQVGKEADSWVSDIHPWTFNGEKGRVFCIYAANPWGVCSTRNKFDYIFFWTAWKGKMGETKG